jgi:hypothetical protein
MNSGSMISERDVCYNIAIRVYSKDDGIASNRQTHRIRIAENQHRPSSILDGETIRTLRATNVTHKRAPRANQQDRPTGWQDRPNDANAGRFTLRMIQSTRGRLAGSVSEVRRPDAASRAGGGCRIAGVEVDDHGKSYR